MLKQRILSALIMIPLALLGLFFLSPLPFFLAISVLVVLGMWEWAQFAGIKRSIGRIIVALVTLGILLFPIMAGTYSIKKADFLNDVTTPLLFVGVIWWLVALFLVIGYPKTGKFWAKSISAKFIFGFLTLVPFLIAMPALRFYHYHSNPYQGAFLLLYVLVLVWSADSGAYFFGRALGKHKLAPKVSPGKSIEGAIGGLVTAGVVSFIFLQVNPSDMLSAKLNMAAFIVVSILTVAISILGDLTESMFKRQAGVKDSSNLIPGHGGILDRIDSLTAAVPFFAVAFLFFL
ncbi:MULTISPECIES: phosphatidate cytidylyltransferase [Pasteurellaceae]|uniref:Phosphatidate cytidylyltransferase n=1 Tax=Pasteurella atlantica TaxID=2827233 RepID=A0AAW8CQL5_9PAST|nr:phosphatidate cytidylyltransferase [Pasteurella atlantica]MBR0573737.1 phosphatidate cytidylyltransferase [Pasteurella atlantica]MDP8039628.1 phosphatidate cytidylyltransferase [Pasteurella atlantica]MDP8041719.1 phosphatidate cytidylyltransferase [Pasteurella atlantica]MDP8044007.1 phosphatidate cytidylyltransferase [Pasteurella atlantica]MDP8045985.1 phosphatidate cytidylyltransferase [Pasteurella atlantica]